jgi:hypothetical protein
MKKHLHMCEMMCAHRATPHRCLYNSKSLEPAQRSLSADPLHKLPLIYTKQYIADWLENEDDTENPPRYMIQEQN